MHIWLCSVIAEVSCFLLKGTGDSSKGRALNAHFIV